MNDAKSSKWRGWWWKIPLAFVGALVVLAMFAGGGLPECDSSEARSLLMQTVTESPGARSNHLTAIDVTQARQVRADERARECSAVVALNSAEQVQVSYTMRARDDGRYSLTFEARR